MIDDGTGHDISIPLLMVDQKIGKDIVRYMDSNELKGVKIQPKISILFEVKAVKVVNYTLNFATIDR